MILHALVLSAAAAFAGAAAPAQPAKQAPEETLRLMLLKLRHNDAWKAHEQIMGEAGSADQLRDAVAFGKGPQKKELADRLPGMAQEPFDLCRSLERCPDAPQSLHVEDPALIDDAFLALARPWLKLQQARGKDVSLSVDPGVGVQLTLQDLPARPTVTLEANPAPTGGFDVLLDDGPQAAQEYASQRAAVLQKKTGPGS